MTIKNYTEQLSSSLLPRNLLLAQGNILIAEYPISKSQTLYTFCSKRGQYIGYAVIQKDDTGLHIPYLYLNGLHPKKEEIRRVFPKVIKMREQKCQLTKTHNGFTKTILLQVAEYAQTNNLKKMGIKNTTNYGLICLFQKIFADKEITITNNFSGKEYTKIDSTWLKTQPRSYKVWLPQHTRFEEALDISNENYCRAAIDPSMPYQLICNDDSTVAVYNKITGQTITKEQGLQIYTGIPVDLYVTF